MVNILKVRGIKAVIQELKKDGLSRNLRYQILTASILENLCDIIEDQQEQINRLKRNER